VNVGSETDKTPENKYGRTMPRPKFKPTDEQRKMAENLSGIGMTEIEIAGAMNIDPKTFRKYFHSELKVGPIKARVSVKRSFFKMATSEKNFHATAAWLRQDEHKRQREEMEHRQPVPEESDAELDNIINAELDAIAAAGAAAGVRHMFEAGDENDLAPQMGLPLAA
jgi:hypothetical protein